MRRALVALACALLALFASRPAWAHKPSDAYVTLEVDGARVAGRIDVALRDLDLAVGLDGDGDGRITWGELRARAALVEGYALGRLALRVDDGACPASVDAPLRTVEHSDGTYAVLAFTAACPRAPDALTVEYRLLFDADPQHRGLAQLVTPAGARSAIFSASEPSQRFAVSVDAAARWRAFRAMVNEGIVHIGQGYDHVLFLLALLLPAVLSRGPRGWRPVGSLRAALADVLRIVTSFTVAHSITLTLSALGVLALPSRFVESAIAASVVVAALNNVVPILGRDRWTAAFALGLLHGFGFSSTLADLGLSRAGLAASLFGFNVGVELGQLAIVALFVPCAFAVRATRGYRWVVLTGGSVVIGIVASLWLVERAFALRILS